MFDACGNFLEHRVCEDRFDNGRLEIRKLVIFGSVNAESETEMSLQFVKDKL